MIAIVVLKNNSMTNNKVNPGKGYRLLKDKEIPIEGDEFQFKGEKWQRLDDDSFWMGHPLPEYGVTRHWAVRRKVETPKGWNVTFKSRKDARFAVELLNSRVYAPQPIRGPHKA